MGISFKGMAHTLYPIFGPWYFKVIGHGIDYSTLKLRNWGNTTLTGLASLAGLAS